MANKFLGLDSINVLKDYIDKQILLNEESTRIVTIPAYIYAIDGVVPATPAGGAFDPEGAGITYPNGWSSLKLTLGHIGDNEDIEAALAVGSIWMSVGVAEGNNAMTDTWSTPIKISGQNGVSVRFAYSYDPNSTIEECTTTPSGTDADHRIEYVWTKYGTDDWTGPTVWSRYVTDASDVLYRYCTTATNELPEAPIDDVDPKWSNSAASSVTQDRPFMWMSTKRVRAGVESNDAVWGEPILFGHYGLDGNIPDYSVTLYAMSDSFENVPEFLCEEEQSLSDVYEVNAEVWSDLPMSDNANESTIWWYVIVNVNGGNRDNPELKDTVKNFSVVKRFSAIDGDVQTSVFTKYLYYWSSTQTLPEELEDEAWIDTPEYKPEDHDGSLWMKVGVAKLDTTTGDVVMVNTDKPWSDPIKITGPRGPIAYDYRTESMYGAGTDVHEPTIWKPMSEVKTSSANPYIWEKRYLSLYKMKYADTPNDDGTYDVVEDSYVGIIGEPDVFRLSGLNGAAGEPGANGNRLNTIDYATSNKDVTISNFDEINYFISNASEDTHYTIAGNKFGDMVSGYTGKFANIGTGNMIINVTNGKIVGSTLETTEIIVHPQESIDLISYNNEGESQFILIGKALTIDEPTIDEPTIDEPTIDEPEEPVEE